ncbi:MAG: hypothetical protein QME64_02720 [bacterium]|nr:hypothetical protein [bacterium]
MTLKKSIWENKRGEEKLYKHLKSIWENKFNIYKGAKFTDIFIIDSIKNISEEERRFLETTEIDITVCDKYNDDKALMCIEFDGMCKGHSKNDKYTPIKYDPIRKMKFKLKLRLAKDDNYPFIVIANPETEPNTETKNIHLSEGSYLAIIDGIIGQTLVEKELPTKIRKEFEEYLEHLKALEENEIMELINNLRNISSTPIMKNNYNIINAIYIAKLKKVLDARGIKLDEHELYAVLPVLLESVKETTITNLELELDPIAKKINEIKDLFRKQGIELGMTTFLGDTEAKIRNTEKISQELRNIPMYRCEVKINTPKGEATGEVFVRDFGNKLFAPFIIAYNCAALLACENAAMINGIYIP